MSTPPKVMRRERGSWRHADCGGGLIVMGHWTVCTKCDITLPTGKIVEKDS